MVDRMLMCVDCGRVINPRTCAGQVAGGMAQALGFAHSEDTYYDKEGNLLNPRFKDYHMYKADEMPQTDVLFVQTDEPSGPFRGQVSFRAFGGRYFPGAGECGA